MAASQPSPPPLYTEHQGHCLLPAPPQQNASLARGSNGPPQYLVQLHEPNGMPQGQLNPIAQMPGSDKSAMPAGGPIGVPQYSAVPQHGEVTVTPQSHYTPQHGTDQHGKELPPPYSDTPGQQRAYPTHPVVPPNYTPYPAHPGAPVHNVTNVVTHTGGYPVYAVNQTTTGTDAVLLVPPSRASAIAKARRTRLGIYCSILIIKLIIVAIIVARYAFFN